MILQSIPEKPIGQNSNAYSPYTYAYKNRPASHHRLETSSTKSLQGDSDMKKKLYHFTTIDVLEKIINNARFFAFHIKYSNDHQEYDDGYVKIYKELERQVEENNHVTTDADPKFADVIKKAFQEIPTTPYSTNNRDYSYFDYNLQKSSPELYAICFTSNEESLAQWVMYAKESGVSIEVDFDGYELVDDGLPEGHKDYFKQKRVKYEIEDDNRTENNKQKYSEIRSFGGDISIHEIKYEKDAIRKLVESKVQRALEELNQSRKSPEGEIFSIINSCFESAPLIKGEEHKGENESRIIIRPISIELRDDENKPVKCHTVVKHIHLGGVLKPYVMAAWRPKNESKPPWHPIKTIIVGPGWNQDLVYKNLIHFINSNKEKIVHESNRVEVLEYANKWFEKTKSNYHDEFMTDSGILVKKSKSSHIFK